MIRRGIWQVQWRAQDRSQWPSDSGRSIVGGIIFGAIHA
jgi:hypothetical protein